MVFVRDNYWNPTTITTSVWVTHTHTHTRTDAYTVVQAAVSRAPGAPRAIIPNSAPPTPTFSGDRTLSCFKLRGVCFLMSSMHTREYSHYITTVALKAIKRTAHILQSVVLQYSISERREPDSRPAEIMDQCFKIPVVLHVKSEATTHVLELITIFVIPLTLIECEKGPATTDYTL